MKENPLVSYASIAKVSKSDLMTTIRLKQMVNQPAYPLSAVSELTAFSKTNAISDLGKDRISSLGTSKYDSVISQFQQKKEQIDKELEQLKK